MDELNKDIFDVNLGGIGVYDICDKVCVWMF